MKIVTLQVGPIGTNCYILCDEEAAVCAVIDPGDEPRRIAAAIAGTGCTPEMILLTHGHFDHIPHQQAHAALGVAGGLHHPHGEAAEGQLVALLVVALVFLPPAAITGRSLRPSSAWRNYPGTTPAIPATWSPLRWPLSGSATPI